jgi:hypothetical protein
VLLTFSTTVMGGQTELIDRVCEAVANLDLEAVLTLGPAVDRDAVRVPENVEVVAFADTIASCPRWRRWSGMVDWERCCAHSRMACADPPAATASQATASASKRASPRSRRSHPLRTIFDTQDRTVADRRETLQNRPTRVTRRAGAEARTASASRAFPGGRSSAIWSTSGSASPTGLRAERLRVRARPDARRPGPDGLPLGRRTAPAARQPQLAAPAAVADHRDDGLREVGAAGRGERIPPVPVEVENEEQVPGRRVPV